METKNESEQVFEQYLDSNGFRGQWTYEPSLSGKNKKPDYMLNWKGNKCFFEVKELRKKPNEPAERAINFNPYLSLRSEIDEAREKFKEYKDYSCSLVIYNICDRTFRSDPFIIFIAMLGEPGIAIELSGKSRRIVNLGGGKMLNKGRKQNTTINSIIVLEEFLDNIEIERAMRKEEKKSTKELEIIEWIKIRQNLYKDFKAIRVPRIKVIENPFARKQFPSDLFNGPFDERWKLEEGLEGKIERVFMGTKLKELEDIKKY